MIKVARNFFWVAILREDELLAPLSGCCEGGDTEPVVSLTLEHRTSRDAFICFFCFRRMLLCSGIRSACHKSSISTLRNRTNPLSRSNAHSATFLLRPRPYTSENRISAVPPLLYSHNPSKTAKDPGCGPQVVALLDKVAANAQLEYHGNPPVDAGGSGLPTTGLACARVGGLRGHLPGGRGAPVTLEPAACKDKPHIDRLA